MITVVTSRRPLETGPKILPDALLDGWEKLCDRASVAPWVADIRDPGLQSAKWTGKFYCGFMSTRGWTVWEPHNNDSPRQLDNIRFIEAARTAIPLMIYEIQRLKFEINKLKFKKGNP